MHRALAALLAVASCVSLAQAQTTAQPSQTPSTFTLERALRAAGATSPSLDAANAGLSSAAAARIVAGLRPNPEVQVEVENVAGTGVFSGTQEAETTAGVALPIELGGKRSARIAVANSQSARAQIEVAIIEADLRMRVTEGYIDAAAAERRIEVAQHLVDYANSGFKAASARVTAGASSPIEQQRAEVERVNASVALETAIREAEVARANLARLIGQPIAGSLDTAWFERIGTFGPRLTNSATNTLIVAAAQADLTTAGAQLRLARSQRIPDVTLSAGARRFSASGDTAAVFGVSIPLPLFNSGKANVAVARAEQQRADARRRMAILDTDQAIATAQKELANSATVARAAGGPALTAANEAARIARIGYSQGKFSQLELLEAERTLGDTRRAWIDALVAFHEAEARLARLVTPAPLPPADPGQ